MLILNCSSLSPPCVNIYVQYLCSTNPHKFCTCQASLWTFSAEKSYWTKQLDCTSLEQLFFPISAQKKLEAALYLLLYYEQWVWKTGLLRTCASRANITEKTWSRFMRTWSNRTTVIFFPERNVPQFGSPNNLTQQAKPRFINITRFFLFLYFFGSVMLGHIQAFLISKPPHFFICWDLKEPAVTSVRTHSSMKKSLTLPVTSLSIPYTQLDHANS